MVSLLEALYIVTALAFVGAMVQLVRKRMPSVWLLLVIGAIGAVVCVVMYWLLRPGA